MNIAEFCIKRRVTTIMAFIMVVIFGIMSFTSLPLALMPDIEIPMALVFTTYQAGPEEIENLVTKKIESACASVSGMEEISSSSSENVSMVMVSFADGTDLDEATTSLREKIDMIKSTLPEDAGAPTIMKIDPDAMPVTVFSLSGNDLSALQKLAEDTISPSLERINGVASVSISGGYENEIAIETYSNRLAGYNLTVPYIAQILSAENITIPAGEVDNGNQTLNVRVDAEFNSIDDIKNVLIPLQTGGSVRLSEIADVSLKPKEQSAIAKLNGSPCVSLSVSKQSGVNTVQVANKIRETLDDLAKKDADIQYEIIMDQSDFINLSVMSVTQNIVLGVILAAIILYIFLRDMGSTTVIAVSMPICIITVFLIMKALNITLNLMSLGGLAMGVGMIVDNSIVVLENIFRFHSEGKSRKEACIEGSKEVALSITASTLTTVAVFLPIGLSGGMTGMMFKEFTITIATLMFASLFIALTLVPLLCYYLMGRGKTKASVKLEEKAGKEHRYMKKYKETLNYLITHRKKAVLISVLAMVGFLVLISFAGVQLIPEMDQSTVSITADLPIGASLEECEEIGDKVVAIVTNKIPEMLESVSYSSGGGSFASMNSGSNSVSVTVNLVDKNKRRMSTAEVANVLREDLADIAGAEISVSASGSMDMSSISGDAIALNISGDNYEELLAVTDDLVEKISALPNAVEVKSSASDQTAQVNVYVKRATASQFGLTAATIGSTVYSELSGSSQTELKIDGDEIDINVTGDTRFTDSIDELKNVMISTPTGGVVPLGLVADVKVELAPQTIVRSNQSRTISITGSSLTDNTMALTQQVNEIVKNYNFPKGIEVESDGEAENIQESFTSLTYALIVALGLVYFILAAQFESFVMPVIIMLVLPLGLIGSLIGLPLTGNPISMPAFIGVIMLAGIVVNSSIILVDYINIRRSRGEEKNTAILNACPLRIRPVLMTTLTTILGLLPMAFGWGEGNEMMAPMAIVMITGMIISTVVTLFFTPVYYSILDTLIAKFKRKETEE
ncbi:MAG: efflux RND transporter permease subunit [Clostridia bacterium]|nr:efflux RND transporter permease subunit [Clostridia bacterium]